MNKRILVIGDAMLDRYWRGDVSRVSPEAPVPVVQVEDISDSLGGAANVAKNLSALGADVGLLCALASDEAGLLLKEMIKERSIAGHFVTTLAPTVVKLRVLGQSQQLLRLDFESTYRDEIDSLILSEFKQQVSQYQWVIFSDYAKGVLRQAPALIAMAKAAGCQVLVDPKTRDFSHYTGADWVTPNLDEFKAVVGPVIDQAEMIVKAQQLLADCHMGQLLLTLGADGMLLITPTDSQHFAAVAQSVYDVTGAGDTVMASLTWLLSQGYVAADAVRLANRAAGLVVRKMGAATVTADELLADEQNTEVAALPVSLAVNQVKLWQQAKQRVVVTNGCFDILHAGHVQFLQQAQALGDKLVVLINDDASISRLKGAERPINNLADRVAVLKALSAVSAVVVFSEDTPKELISALQPDVLVKGDDYQVHEIAGHDVVLATGGEVKTLPLKKGLSTSNIVKKIKKEMV